MSTLNPDSAPPPKEKFRRADTFLWRLLKEAHPNDYADHLRDGITSGLITANQALTFPLGRVLEHHLVALPHKNTKAPDISRDERLAQWFHACVDIGAEVAPALAHLGVHATSGFARLIKMKAFTALYWWRLQGVEGTFPGPHVLGQEPTNFATIAFVEAIPSAVEALLDARGLTHPDKLWHLVWSKRCLSQSQSLVKLLWRFGPPPADALSGLALAPVNKKCINQVLQTAKELVAAGCDPNRAPEGSPPPLAVVLRHLRSPAIVLLVKFLLDHGADPLGATAYRLPGDLEDRHGTIVELALGVFLFQSLRAALRTPARECFELLCRAADPNYLREIFPTARQDEILATVRSASAGPDVFGRSSIAADPHQDASLLQALWLDLSAPAPQVSARISARI